MRTRIKIVHVSGHKKYMPQYRKWFIWHGDISWPTYAQACHIVCNWETWEYRP